jgi:hypothetical protein
MSDCFGFVQHGFAQIAQLDDYSALGHEVDCFCVDTDWSADFYLPPVAALRPVSSQARDGLHGIAPSPMANQFHTETF